MNLQEMKELMPSHTSGTLATFAGNMPDIRGWQFQFMEDGKFYFGTSNTKNVYKQMKENPYVAFMCSVNGYIFRILGKVNFVEDREELTKVHSNLDEIVSKQYKSVDDNGFTAFYIEHGEVKYAKGFAPFESFEF